MHARMVLNGHQFFTSTPTLNIMGCLFVCFSRVAEADGNFFENFSALPLKQGSNLQQAHTVRASLIFNLIKLISEPGAISHRFHRYGSQYFFQFYTVHIVVPGPYFWLKKKRHKRFLVCDSLNGISKSN